MKDLSDVFLINDKIFLSLTVLWYKTAINLLNVFEKRFTVFRVFATNVFPLILPLELEAHKGASDVTQPFLFQKAQTNRASFKVMVKFS